MYFPLFPQNNRVEIPQDWFPLGLISTICGNYLTVDGWNPVNSPVEGQANIPWFTGFQHHPNGGWPWDFWTINSTTLYHRENAGTLGMGPLIINPIYTLKKRGYLLGPISPFKGLGPWGVKQRPGYHPLFDVYPPRCHVSLCAQWNRAAPRAGSPKNVTRVAPPPKGWKKGAAKCAGRKFQSNFMNFAHIFEEKMECQKYLKPFWNLNRIKRVQILFYGWHMMRCNSFRCHFWLIIVMTASHQSFSWGSCAKRMLKGTVLQAEKERLAICGSYSWWFRNPAPPGM